MKHWDDLVSPYLEESNFFQQGVSLINVMHTLTKLVPSCPDCNSPILYYCVEQCCAYCPLFCK